MNLDEPRLNELLAILEKMTAGDFEARFELSPGFDELDAIGYAVNTLAEEVGISRANEKHP